VKKKWQRECLAGGGANVHDPKKKGEKRICRKKEKRGKRGRNKLFAGLSDIGGGGEKQGEHTIIIKEREVSSYGLIEKKGKRRGSRRKRKGKNSHEEGGGDSLSPEKKKRSYE